MSNTTASAEVRTGTEEYGTDANGAPGEYVLSMSVWRNVAIGKAQVPDVLEIEIYREYQRDNYNNSMPDSM